MEPFRYTSGRWLKDDALNLEARHIKFDFEALCTKAIESCPGAVDIADCKMHEGASNRAFIFTMDNGSKIVARIPFRTAGPPRLSTHSEVATIAYVRAHTNVPVPEVVGWSDDPTNPIGTEYMLLEHARGVQLHRVWSEMTPKQHQKSVSAIANLMKDVANLDFPAYGSIYFSDAQCFDSQLRITTATEGFCIGPHCGFPIWPCTARELASLGSSPSVRGPWTSLEGYCSGLLSVGRLRLPANEPAEAPLTFMGDLKEHNRLLDISGKVIKELIKSPRILNIAKPMLFHIDLAKHNIFVSAEDPTQITAIIDWQSASVDPAFKYYNVRPDFTLFPDFDTPPWRTFWDPRPPTEEEKALEDDVEECKSIWTSSLKKEAPTLERAKRTDPVYIRPITNFGSAHRANATVLRDALVSVSEIWEERKLGGTCPYQPSSEEVETNEALYRQHIEVDVLEDSLMDAFKSGSEGWIPAEEFDDAKKKNETVFEQWADDRKAKKHPNQTLSEAKQLWPWDL